MRPRVDAGKHCKESGALKARDARKLDKALRVPPHKKPRNYVLTIEWTETITHREEHRYPSKAAREEAERRMRRQLAEDARSQRYRSWTGADVLYQKVVGPIITQSIEEWSTGGTSE